MSHNTRIFCILVFLLGVLGGCSSAPPASESKKAQVPLDKIQGKAQVLVDNSGGVGDAALNPGGPAIYLWVGTQRYRLFSRTQMEVTHGKEYVVEGVNAQKMIDEIGDPAQGKDGYPLRSSCERVVSSTWRGLAFDALDSNASLLRDRVARYPARPVFLVTKIEPAPEEGAKKEADKKEDAEPVSVPADTQRALLIEGSPVQKAPLWEPAGRTLKCKVIIDAEGKVSDLETGAQLCESMPWSTFRYKPTVRGGRPVPVRTEVEVRFEPRT